MNANPKILTTRVFRAGNSVAVRIPAQFKLAEGEVTIEQRAGGLFITDKRGDWASFFRGEPVDFPFTAKELRDHRPERPVDISWVSDLSAPERGAAARKAPASRLRPKKTAAKKAARKAPAKKSAR
jgi:virulence-associated protein VagC